MKKKEDCFLLNSENELTQTKRALDKSKVNIKSKHLKKTCPIEQIEVTNETAQTIFKSKKLYARTENRPFVTVNIDVKCLS